MSINYTKVFFAVAAAVLVGGASVHANETDERIEAAAQKSYVFKTYLKDDAVKAMSVDGAVTLTGTVNETSHKALAEDTVAGLPGVKSVDNQLALKGEQPPVNSDEWLSAKVKAALLFNRNVSGARTQVYVNEGVVTLKGEADSQAQKDLTGAYAKDVEGVKDVKNEMTLIKIVADKEKKTISDEVDDASVKALVKIAFLMHHSTSAFKTGVEANDGIVTLSGNAVNAAGKDMATKVAADVNGVKSVVNNMTIMDPVLKK